MMSLWWPTDTMKGTQFYQMISLDEAKKLCHRNMDI